MFRISAAISMSLLALCAALALAPGAKADAQHGAETHESISFEHVPGATALEGRIIAPCCWNQTIDIHGSELSTKLRVEIRKRLKNGETADAIEESLVARYGERVIAVPRGSRLGSTGILLAIVMGAAGVFAVSLLRRWRDRTAPPPPREDRAAPASQALDARIDAELAALDRE
jgi:cytochrome c-type biogenesis protein CcmH